MQILQFFHLMSIIIGLWNLKECEKAYMQTRGTDGDENGKSSMFTMLEDNPQIGQTKVSFSYDTMKALTRCLQ